MADLVRQESEAGFNTAGQAIAEGKTVQQIQTKYATAVSVQKPRDLVEVEQKCMVEAALAGEVCFYGWGSGKNRVEGPSIDCAMIAARNWGNAALEMRPIVETNSAYVMEAAFVDLETGFTYSRQFRQSKNWTVFGNLDDERKADVRFQIGQSKAQRNAILKALPKWLLNKMVDKAKVGVRAKLDAYIEKNGTEAARKLAMDALAKQGVSLERIEKKYGKKYGAWDVDLLVILKGDIRALADGAESADSLYPEDSEQASKPDNEGGSLSAEDMKAGDPNTHQGHEPEPKPEKQLFDVKDVEELEAEGGLKSGPLQDARMKYAKVLDLVGAKQEDLQAYGEYLTKVKAKKKEKF